MTAEQIKKDFQFILPAGLMDFEWEAIIKKVNKIRQEDLEEIERIISNISILKPNSKKEELLYEIIEPTVKEVKGKLLSKIKELYK